MHLDIIFARDFDTSGFESDDLLRGAMAGENKNIFESPGAERIADIPGHPVKAPCINPNRTGMPINLSPQRDRRSYDSIELRMLLYQETGDYLGEINGIEIVYPQWQMGAVALDRRDGKEKCSRL